MFKNTRKLLLFVSFFLIIGQSAQAEKYDFEKEKELTDKGYCEEALLENDKAVEYIKKRNKNKKHYQEMFEIFRINRRVHILSMNCKRKDEALQLALKSLDLEKANTISLKQLAEYIRDLL